MRLLALQHGLPSVATLVERIQGSGLADRLDLYLKDYSSIPGAIPGPFSTTVSGPFCPLQGLQDDEHLLILDEGGWLHRNVPIRSVGVEQTTSGMQEAWRYPVVLVCRSAAKLVFESQVIARAIRRKLASLDLPGAGVIGVIGAGALGSELSFQLREAGHHVVTCDRPSSSISLNDRMPLQALVEASELILGCSGRDVLHGVDLSGLRGRKIFASCSSSDVEFEALLSRLRKVRRQEIVSGTVGSAECIILNGGFPLNFDRQKEWETPSEISLTRDLCFEGLVQATRLRDHAAGGIMLDPEIQMHCVSDWLSGLPDPAVIRLPASLDVAFFRSHSEGTCAMAGEPEYQLHWTTPGALEQMRAHEQPYDTAVCGRSIHVLPSVWSPRYDWSSEFYVENFPDVHGRSFLEIGSGTGVISVFAGLKGASRIVAVDVNEVAVLNTRFNFERYNLSDAVAMRSEGFKAVRGRFDVVTWNAPYHGSRPADILERGCADEDYSGIRAFFAEVGDYLNPGGLVVFGFSESGDLALIRSLMNDSALRVKQEFSDWRAGYNCMLFVLEHLPQEQLAERLSED